MHTNIKAAYQVEQMYLSQVEQVYLLQVEQMYLLI